MNFEQVLKTLLTAFERHHIRYAAIGGFAVGALGVRRTTMDLDFLIHRDDMAKLHAVLTGLGYQRAVHTENVSQYGHADPVWGALDFIHAFRKPSLDMIQRASSVSIFEKTQAVKVAQPEDVIGLKIQAIANNPKRRTKELSDIEQLVELYQHHLDWQRIQEFYELFELGEEGRQLKKRFGHAE